jgi:hypothetical protein
MHLIPYRDTLLSVWKKCRFGQFWYTFPAPEFPNFQISTFLLHCLSRPCNCIWAQKYGYKIIQALLVYLECSALSDGYKIDKKIESYLFTCRFYLMHVVLSV